MRINDFGKTICVVALSLLGGCGYFPAEKNVNAPPDALNDTPLVIDGAMQAREWDRSAALYSTGGVEAGPTLFALRSTASSGLQASVTETPLFLFQVLALPVQAFRTPVWEQQVYKGATVPTSFNGVGPLPPSSAMTEAAPTTQH